MPDLSSLFSKAGFLKWDGAGNAASDFGTEDESDLAADPALTGAFAPVTGRPVAGFYYGTPASGLTALAVTLNRLYLTPWLVTAPCSLDRIAAEITTGAASAVVRLGIYATAADGKPGDLVVDAGTIDGNSVAIQELTIAVDLAPGLYWLAAAAQGGAPQMRVFTIAPSFYTPHDLAGISTNNRSGFYGTASGAFASAPTIINVIATPPRVFVRAA